MFADGKPFTYIRWGDGEWMQTDRPEYKEVLRSYLSYESTNYFAILGTFFICQENHNAMFKRVARVVKDLPAPVPFMEGFYLDNALGLMHRIWSQARAEGGDLPLQHHVDGPALTCADLEESAPEKTSVVLVGPQHLHRLSVLFRGHEWISATDADDRHQQIADQMLQVSAARPEEHLYFLIAVGWGKLPIMHKVYEHVKSKDTVIDIGSSFDAYANVLSRDYSRKHKARICKETPCFALPGTCA
jgi:hypothetical protein